MFLPTNRLKEYLRETNLTPSQIQHQFPHQSTASFQEHQPKRAKKERRFLDRLRWAIIGALAAIGCGIEAGYVPVADVVLLNLGLITGLVMIWAQNKK